MSCEHAGTGDGVWKDKKELSATSVLSGGKEAQVVGIWKGPDVL